MLGLSVGLVAKGTGSSSELGRNMGASQQISHTLDNGKEKLSYRGRSVVENHSVCVLYVHISVTLQIHGRLGYAS